MTWRFICTDVLFSIICIHLCMTCPSASSCECEEYNGSSSSDDTSNCKKDCSTSNPSTTGCSTAILTIELKTKNFTGKNIYADSSMISTERSEIANPKITIFLPPDLFSNVPWKQNPPKMVNFIFSVQTEKPYQNSETLLNNIRLGIDAENVIIKKLSTPFKMTAYQTSPLMEGYRPSCVFWNQSGQWDTYGCTTEAAPDKTICRCDHFSFFAVLLVGDVAVSKVHAQVLQYLTYIGCAISAAFCIIALLTHLLHRRRITDHALAIHLQLVGALLLLNLLFLCSVGVAPLKIPGLCITTAVLLHYALLCCFTWMALEAVHLYRLMIKVYNTYIRHYLLKISIVGWGGPAVVVVIIIIVSPRFYGHHETGAGEMCWIRSLVVHYASIVAYFVLVLLFNSAVLIYIVVKMFHLHTQQPSPENSEHTRTLCSVLGLTCALGVTWGLGFLSIGYTNLPILYTFTILNSLQGFFICIWICVMQYHRLRTTELATSGWKTTDSSDKYHSTTHTEPPGSEPGYSA